VRARTHGTATSRSMFPSIVSASIDVAAPASDYVELWTHHGDAPPPIDAKALRPAQDALQLLLDTDSAVMQVEALAELAEVLTLAGDSGAAWALGEARRLAEAKENISAAAALDELAGRLEDLPARAL